MRLVLLPGMDGTGELFARFVDARPEGIETQIVSFPGDAPLDYDALAAHVQGLLPTSGPWLLLGESFSGPLALRLAERRPAGLVGVVLAASFVSPPGAARHVGPFAGILSRARPPRWLLARLLTGGDRHVAAEVHRALGRVAPAVVAARVRAIGSVDARESLRNCPVPVLGLHATEDRLVGTRAAQEIRAARPDAHAVSIQAPHLVLQTAPGAAWDAVTRVFS